MPLNKQQLLRLQIILTMMRENKHVNFKSFQKETKALDDANVMTSICSKTFSRDIKILKEDFHAPIEYDKSEKKHYLLDPTWHNSELLANPYDMKAAILGERIASKILPPIMSAEISKAVSSLLQRNETGMADDVMIESFQFLKADFLPQIDPKIFLTCYNAWEQRHSLVLTYCSSKGTIHEKRFDPHIIAWCDQHWYLKGLLHRDDDNHYTPPKSQVLALQRIQEIKTISTETFFPEPALLKKMHEEGLFDFEKMPEVLIIFDKPFDLVADELFNGGNGVILERTENTTKVCLKNISEHQVLQLFFRAQGHATIIAPENMRAKVRKIARKILEKHPED